MQSDSCQAPYVARELPRAGAKEIFNDSRIFIHASFISDLRESFGEIMVVCDWTVF